MNNTKEDETKFEKEDMFSFRRRWISSANYQRSSLFEHALVQADNVCKAKLGADKLGEIHSNTGFVKSLALLFLDINLLGRKSCNGEQGTLAISRLLLGVTNGTGNTNNFSLYSRFSILKIAGLPIHRTHRNQCFQHISFALFSHVIQRYKYRNLVWLTLNS